MGVPDLGSGGGYNVCARVCREGHLAHGRYSSKRVDLLATHYLAKFLDLFWSCIHFVHREIGVTPLQDQQSLRRGRDLIVDPNF